MTANGNMAQLAKNINDFFWSVASDLPPLPKENKYSQIEYSHVPDQYIISIQQVDKNLSQIKLGKAPGPDEITSWMLRDLAPILAPPIASLFKASIRDSYVPPASKSANIIPLPKKCPPKKNRIGLETSFVDIVTCQRARENYRPLDQGYHRGTYRRPSV